MIEHSEPTMSSQVSESQQVNLQCKQSEVTVLKAINHFTISEKPGERGTLLPLHVVKLKAYETAIKLKNQPYNVNTSQLGPACKHFSRLQNSQICLLCVLLFSSAWCL